MNSQQEQPRADVIEAAGGILWRKTPTGPELVLVHRPRYDDWTLPKGKREPGERWQETALREVYEETSYKASLEGFIGSTAYLAEGIPKVVLFWNMTIDQDAEFQPNHEVDEIIWLPLEEALQKISYESERALLIRVANQ